MSKVETDAWNGLLDRGLGSPDCVTYRSRFLRCPRGCFTRDVRYRQGIEPIEQLPVEEDIF